MLIAAPSPAEAASPGVPGGTCTIAFGTVPYGSSGNTHVQAGGTAEQIDCDPRYPAADSGVAAPNSGASTGGGTWSAVTNVSDNTVTYAPHPRWVGPDTFTMYFCNDVNCTGAGRVTATVNVTVAAPTISLTASLPNGTVATAYSQTLTASGSASPYAFSVVSGALPAGLSLGAVSNPTGSSSTVTLSGTPTAGGTFNFTIRATDNSIGTGPLTRDQAYTVTLAPPTISVSPTTIPNGTRGTAYSQTLTANGGTAPRTWSVSSGALPAGLTLSTAGVVSGTPTATGSFTFVARAQDSSTGTGAPYAGTRSYTFSIAEILPVANAVSATVAYGSTANPIMLNITGGPATSVAIAANGTRGTATAVGTSITYTPTAGYAGPDSFTYTATNAAGTSAPATVTITVSPPTLSLNPATLPGGTLGVAYSQTTTASGGTAAYTYSISVGALPAGLTINSSTGEISGTPTATGSSTFTVRAEDSSTGPAAPFAITRSYTVEILAPPVTITSPAAGALPSATGGVAYSQSFVASGTVSPYDFAHSGTLPNGMSLSTAGVLSGTPTAAGTFNFSVTATDSSPTPGPYTSPAVAYSLTVVAPTITVSPATLPNATTALAYSQTITDSGGTAPRTLSITAGTLPAGLNLVGSVLSGTPTAAGTSNFTITATDALGFTGSRAYTVVVADPVISITSPATGALPSVTGGVAYSQTFTASGGQGSHSFAVTAGATPPGVVLSPAGTLSGTPTASGTFNFSVTATDASLAIDGGPFSSAPVAYSLTVNAPTIAVSPTTLANATTALAYSEMITATGGTTPHTFSITAGTQPTGMALTSAGVLSGTPTATGTFNFTVTATDALSFTGSRAYSIVVADPVITIASPAAGALPGATGGTAYSQTFTASGGQGSHSFDLTGTLPAGMSFASTGVLSGTPSVSGTFNFTLVARDSSPGPSGPFTSAPVAYSLTVAAPTITVSPASLPNATASLPYSQTFTANGGTAPHSFSLDTGSLPVGMSLSSTGAFSGTPTVTGTHNFTILATDTHGFTGSQAYSVVVDDQPGQVTMLVSSPADGAFGFSSGEPSLNFTVNTASGSGTSGARTVPIGNHSFALSVPAGFELAAANCSAGGAIDPATLSGTLNVTPGAAITCTISGADPSETTGLIGTFLEARSNLILTNEPNASRRIERLTGAYTGTGGVSGFGLGFSDNRMPFALSLSENEASFGYSLRRSQAQTGTDMSVVLAREPSPSARRGMPDNTAEMSTPLMAFGEGGLSPAKRWPIEARRNATSDVPGGSDPTLTPFDVWIEGKLARFDSTSGDGRFGILHAGMDYLVTPRILIGLGAQLDWTDMEGSGSSTMSGTGYLFGPYVTARLTDHLFLDGRAAWGQSANDVSPFGAYTDKLDATRWLVSVALIGQYDIDRWRLAPKAKLAYFEEQTDPYVDGLGIEVPAISIATGTFEFGPTLSYSMELANGMSFEPFASVEGIWTFKQENTSTSATSSPGLAETGLRGRGEVGFTLAGQSASSLSTSVFYDGVGNDDFQAWGGRLRFNHRF